MPQPRCFRVPLLVIMTLAVSFIVFSATNPASDLRAARTVQPGLHRVSRISDWSTHHVVYPRVGPAAIRAAVRDPRAAFGWRGMYSVDSPDPNSARLGRSGRRRFIRDWSISLGTSHTASAMYPAKFTFDVNATPNCSTDFVVFPVAATGTSTQPNIVAFNNLYSGGALLSDGFCNRTPTASDTGVSATVM